ncbi:hypothetical protein IT568_02740 [bacterium]|nr:hypothetical protein [bacterium]
MFFASEFGHSKETAQRLKELFDGKDIFDYPKSVPLLKRLLQLYTTSEVLDFFAGSVTTSQAVMELNHAKMAATEIVLGF